MAEYDIIIAGAGPAGLLAGITSAASGSRVLVIEKSKSAGLKLLMSGSGRCNITHTGNIKNFFSHYGKNDKFIRPALLEFKNIDLINFLAKHKLGIIVNEDDKVFPDTEDARDVLDILLKECRIKGVVIKYREPVNNIRQIDNYFEIKAGVNIYKSKIVILATGGRSYPSTGSTGDGYVFARELGHKIVDPAPALTPVRIKEYPFWDLEGIALYDSVAAIFREGRKIEEKTGDLMLTRSGLSGPAILDLSRYIKPGDVIKVSLMNQDNLLEFRSSFLNEIAMHGKSKLKNLLDDYNIPDRLKKRIFDVAGVNYDIKAAELKKNDRKLLEEYLAGFPFTVESLGGYNIAMVTRGGVDLSEVNPKTMESRLVSNLFFAGEVLDIDGDTGGYNLQAAFSTGYLAGRSAASKNQES